MLPASKSKSESVGGGKTLKAWRIKLVPEKLQPPVQPGSASEGSGSSAQSQFEVTVSQSFLISNNIVLSALLMNYSQ